MKRENYIFLMSEMLVTLLDANDNVL